MVGLAVTSVASSAPGRMRQRDATKQIAAASAAIAANAESAISQEVLDLKQVAGRSADFGLDPDRTASVLEDLKLSNGSSYFAEFVILGPVVFDGEQSAESAANAPIVSHRIRRSRPTNPKTASAQGTETTAAATNGSGSRLQQVQMSVGKDAETTLSLLGLPRLPLQSATPTLLSVEGATLNDQIMGTLTTGARTVIPAKLSVLAVPAPGRGWVLAVAQPNGIEQTVSTLIDGQTMAASLHLGPTMASPAVAQVSATEPPAPEQVRWSASPVNILGKEGSVIIGVDRHYGTGQPLPAGVIFFTGSVFTLAAAAAAAASAQRRIRIAMAEELAAERLIARTDELTGLGNRLAVQGYVDQAIAALDSDQTPVTLLLCDLDRFKVVNDARGHDVGDQLLRDVGQRMRETIGDTGGAEVFRLGGDEFVIALTGATNTINAVDVAHNLVAALRSPFQVGSDPVVIGVSIGLATATLPGSFTRSSLLRDADMAMYVAKRGGGNRVAVAGDEVRNSGASQLDLEIAIRGALGTGQFRAWYQPIVNERREVTALEALIRWEHPDRGIVSPGQFLPAAKQAGLLAELSTVVLAQACNDVAEWNRQRAYGGLAPLVVHVNCVEEQLMDSGFADVVGSFVQSSGISPQALLLEISEETALDRLPASIPTMELLRGMGVRFSIDDFGFGNSSLTMIRRVGEVAELKLDKSIVDGLADDAIGTDSSADLAVIRAIIDFAKGQSITVVAEGIEQENQFMKLRAMGIELFQGYLFFKPQPVAQLDELLSGRRILALQS